jgi:hypothetical protein
VPICDRQVRLVDSRVAEISDDLAVTAENTTLPALVAGLIGGTAIGERENADTRSQPSSFGEAIAENHSRYGGQY